MVFPLQKKQAVELYGYICLNLRLKSVAVKDATAATILNATEVGFASLEQLQHRTK